MINYLNRALRKTVGMLQCKRNTIVVRRQHSGLGRRADSKSACKERGQPCPPASQVFWGKPHGHGCPYLFGVLPASCRQNETLRDRKTCRRDAGSTLERHHEALLNRYGCPRTFLNPRWLAILFPLSNSPRPQV